MPTLLKALGAALIVSVAWHRLASWRIKRSTGARLRTGRNGIIPGAGPLELGAEHADGVLLLHGFGDSPQTLTYLAEHLHRAGYAVVAPLLPGHGRTLREFSATGAHDWIEGAREAQRAMRGRHERVALVGLSMGGALASILAADGGEVSALVLIAPYLDAPPLVRQVARFARVLGAGIPYVTGASEHSIHDELERERSLAYRAVSPALLRQLVSVADRARAVLPNVTVPTLIIQSREDNRVATAVAEAALSRLGARDKHLEWLNGCGHVVTVDRQRDRVFAATSDWLERYLRGEPTIATTGRAPQVHLRDNGSHSAQRAEETDK